MTPQHVISQLLESDSRYPQNMDLLKKIIITAYLGRLQINNQPPDNQVALGNYLFDDEDIMFDFSRLSEEKRKIFNEWLLDPHQEDKANAYFTGVSVNEYRGFSAEVFLNWWGRIKNWMDRRHSEHWKVADINLSLDYQLTGIEMSHGKNGILIGFNQFLVPSTGTKYRDPNDSQREPLGNTKRLFVTDNLVNQLTRLNIKNLQFESVCKSPHPQSIEVNDLQERFDRMYDYRKMQKFIALKPWYVRFWLWLIPSNIEDDTGYRRRVPIDNKLVLLHETKTIQILQFSKTHEVVVKERKPDIENVVYCGGGAKIFGHVGFWSALTEAKIHPRKFAGSSAGAIMALLCYLGYSAAEITELFKNFKQEHLVHFDININGLSEPHSLKTALDFAIAYRLKQITTQYNIPYPEGKITFATLDSIRRRCPGCGLGEELIVTATNKRVGKTRYFSLGHSPNFEVSEAVKISASFPVVYRSTLLDGDEHNDGGILSNFPTEAFFDDHSTLLESEYGNNLKVLAVQFDNGTERTAIDRVMDRVYKENFFLNWIYRLLTGVSDPASGWEQDRMKLRKYASQSIVISVDTVASSSFSVDDETRNKMIQNGYDATKSYLNMRYHMDEQGSYQNEEMMYTTFTSLGDLLTYCCYRGDDYWFEIVNDFIVQSTVPNKTELMQQAAELRALYFNSGNSVLPERTEESDNPLTFFGNSIPHEPTSPIGPENYQILLAVYPVFLKLTPELLTDETDKRIFDYARHSFSLHSPFTCLEHFAKITHKTHVILHVVINIIKELQNNSENELNSDDDLYESLSQVVSLLGNNPAIYDEEYYSRWDLSLAQSLRVLNLLNSDQNITAPKLLNYLNRRSEPMQTIINGVFHDDLSYEELEDGSTTMLNI